MFKTYVIENKVGEYWSNEFGWVESGFDTFTDFDRNHLDLPIGGFWVGYES